MISKLTSLWLGGVIGVTGNSDFRGCVMGILGDFRLQGHLLFKYLFEQRNTIKLWAYLKTIA
jgi:hypothetical protein